METVAAATFGVEAPCVAAVAGAEAALRWLPALLRPEAVSIDAPTYGGHADAWRAAGVPIQPDAPVRVLVNPNNPDGRVREPQTLAAIADALGARGGRLIVDESFVDPTPMLSAARLAHPAIIALRSFGKFYGLAGLRLGFVIAEPALAGRIRQAVGDWPVSADALAAGLAAYRDVRWAVRTRARLARDAARLDGLLSNAGFEIVGGTTLFRLTRTKHATACFEALARRGILTRPFEDQPTWLRFGLPSPAAWPRVRAALAAL